ncbi:hypothetical protein KGF57_002277 [Candida theae]|uniref:Uncharacterized protein n=1 Tax=Candida theae TaxID=1198502 RepID=A0AAD5BFK6_9ASCO|nr:uncharacterized protein KGF57_002277 [Candida theae]KAI5958843.1 hypothetical protein KGF57_002277 [Candida theae]
MPPQTIPPFRLYGGDDYQIVGDASRFEHSNEYKLPRLRRSRNTTPTNSEFTEVDSSMAVSRASSAKLTLDGIIPFYASQGSGYNNESDSYYRSLRSNQFTQDDNDPSLGKTVSVRRQQVSIGVQAPQDNLSLPPLVPPKDTLTRTKSQREFIPYPPSIPDTSNAPPYSNNMLPPLPQPSEKLYAKVTTQFDNSGDIDSVISRQKVLEHDLIKQVMNQPLISIRADKLGDRYYGRKINITMNLMLYLFEICLSIIEIVLASVLLQCDTAINIHVYRYLIADGTITIIVAILFSLHIVTYEKRNGSFYCTAAVVFKLISFIMIVSYILPNNQSQPQHVWQVRRALGAFIIISTFIWISNLIMFLTTLYISRLNLLEDLNFDFDKRGLNEEFNTGLNVEREWDVANEDLMKFYLNENGEMYALHNAEEIEKYKDNNKILVYTF